MGLASLPSNYTEQYEANARATLHTWRDQIDVNTAEILEARAGEDSLAAAILSIASGNIPDATETAGGKVRLATDAEHLSGAVGAVVPTVKQIQREAVGAGLAFYYLAT